MRLIENENKGLYHRVSMVGPFVNKNLGTDRILSNPPEEGTLNWNITKKLDVSGKEIEDSNLELHLELTYVSVIGRPAHKNIAIIPESLSAEYNSPRDQLMAEKNFYATFLIGIPLKRS